MIETNANPIAFAGFGVVLTMIIVWFVMTAKLFNRLSEGHPAKYEAMGRPTLFLRNNIATGFMTAKFLLLREHKGLGDPALSKLADFMLCFLAVYVAVFAWFIHYTRLLPMHAA
jgi:hypothetical protein